METPWSEERLRGRDSGFRNAGECLNHTSGYAYIEKDQRAAIRLDAVMAHDIESICLRRRLGGVLT